MNRTEPWHQRSGKQDRMWAAKLFHKQLLESYSLLLELKKCLRGVGCEIRFLASRNNEPRLAAVPEVLTYFPNSHGLVAADLNLGRQLI